MIFDTGSSNTWVPSAKCQQSCGGKALFQSDQSHSFAPVCMHARRAVISLVFIHSFICVRAGSEPAFVCPIFFVGCVPAILYSSCSCGRRECHNPNQPHTPTPQNGTVFKVRYGSGAVQGFFAEDSMGVAGFTIQNQTFAEVTDASGLGRRTR